MKNIVLDMDETLLHSYFEDLEKYRHINPKKFTKLIKQGIIKKFEISLFDKKTGKLVDYNYWIVKRPFLDEFIQFIFKNFNKVIIWSAGSDEYVKEIIDFVFMKYQKPHIIWTKDRTKETTKDDYTYITKPLSKLFRHDKNFNIKNTIIIDNLDTNFAFDNKFNGITIPHFEPTIESILSDNIKDNCLKELINWFKMPEFILCDDIRYLDKTKIFSEHYEKENQPKPKN